MTKTEYPQNQTQSQELVIPVVVHRDDTPSSVRMNPEAAAQTLRELGVSEQGIRDTTIYMDSKSRFQTYGTHYPSRIGRLRFPSIPEVQQAKGDIIRLSTVMKGVPRTPDEINHTFVHEAEHRAQQERHDPKVTEGHVAIWGLALAGAVIGNRLGRGKGTKAAGSIVGAAIGHTVGYTIAPHERQARARARQTTSTAVRKK